MTRWARVNQAHSSKTEEATPWTGMVKQNEEASTSKTNNSNKIKKKKLSSKKKDKKSIFKPDETQETKDAPPSVIKGKNTNIELLERKRFVKKNKNGYIDLEPEVEQRLQSLKRSLWKKGMSGEEIRQVIRKERRHEEIKRKRELKRVLSKHILPLLF